MEKKTSPALGRKISQLFAVAQEREVLDQAAPLPMFAPMPGALADAWKSADATPPTAAAPRGRRKLWQLEDKLHCPVVGTCLPMDELEAMGKKHRFMSGRENEFSLHVEAVNRSRERNAFAEALQKYLDRRYQVVVREFDKLRSDREVATQWRHYLAKGDVAGALWAVVTHPASSQDTRDMAYGDIHMLSHQVGAGQTADVRRMETLAKELAEHKKHLEQLRQEQARRELQWQERLRLAEETSAHASGRDQAIAALEARLAQYENGSVMVDMGRKLMQLSAANEHLIALGDKARQQEEQLRTLREQLARTEAENLALAAEREALEALLMRDDGADCDSDCGQCPEAENLRGRRVLCVGGRSQLVIHYRRLAQRLGIKLIHHDGGMEESLSRLPDMISGADAVICPTDCVSHPAYYRIKNQCKRLGKPCLLFKGAGVSSFAAALVKFSAEQEGVDETY
ncbi:DUF2325 domain-containing protein [Denitratisoma sp. agr-D3]